MASLSPISEYLGHCVAYIIYSGDDDIHSDLSVKQEGKDDILEPTFSGRNYTKLIGKIGIF